MSAPLYENDAWNTLVENRNNLTALKIIEAPRWVSAAEFRGTMAILQSCILTIVACVYTALHMNVLESSRSTWSQLLQKIKWVTIALLAPEVVLACAAGQLQQALQFRNAMRKLQAKSTGEHVKRFDISLTYAFFVVMGGLRIRVSDLAPLISVQDIPDSMYRAEVEKKLTSPGSTIVLTTMGAQSLAKKEMWFYVSGGVIKNKSKANTIQKALVMLQVSWMFLQCIARKIYGLPLTLLELHTMVHVFCAFFMYIFWFNKPLDVTEPSVQFEERWSNMLAVLLEASGIFSSRSQEDDVISANAARDARLTRVAEVFLQEKQDALAKKQTQPHREFFLLNYRAGLVFNSEGVVPLGKHPNLTNESGLEAAMDSLWTGGLTTLALTLTLPAAYGGVHLAAWRWSFPTAIERLLWKVSSLIVAGTTPAIMAVFANNTVLEFIVRNIASCIRRVRKRHANENETREMRPWEFPLSGPIDFIYMASMTLLIISCVVARLYIIIESFIGLRLVPIGVYWMPFWLEMIPHV